VQKGDFASKVPLLNEQCMFLVAVKL